MPYDRKLPKKSEDLSDWYNKLIIEAELADYGPARGTMIFRPYGYGIWEQIQAAMDPQIKASGTENAYFPIFIPNSFLEREKHHLEGFAPELAVVTHGGGEKLAEPLVVRPTSETVIHDSFSKWIRSWRDLPMKLNQWCNVVRWEKRTYLFMRTSEFLWQEGHTAHATHEDAHEMQDWAMEMYVKIYREYFAVAAYVGHKSASERFPGADDSLTYEALMPSGKALQSATSHDLGQNFSRVFDIKYQTKDGKDEFAWLTSWGLSTRSIGGLILVHGDDLGLKLPPKLAPVQVVILPVKAEPELIDYSKKLAEVLGKIGLRVKVDARDGESIGFRINKWELKGAPVRVEIGGKEVEAGTLTIARRDGVEKQVIKMDEAADKLIKILDEIQAGMLVKSEKYLRDNTHSVETFDQFKDIMVGSKGFIRAFWCEEAACEEKIKTETKASTRCLELDAKAENGKCVHCGQSAKYRWLFAQAY